MSHFLCGWQITSRVQMTEDELVIHFFQFDGNSLSTTACAWKTCMCMCVPIDYLKGLVKSEGWDHIPWLILGMSIWKYGQRDVFYLSFIKTYA